ncbi:MAG TPA: hypothetical protein VIJ40_00060 [Acidimicrobiales bacterium]
MANQPSKHRRLSRNQLYLVAGLFIALVVLVANFSALAAAILLIVGFGSVGIFIARERSALGRYALSTECEKCGAPLQEHVGMPERVRPNCGHTQSWAKR